MKQVWRESGLGAAPDLDQLQRQIITLEQQLAHARGQLGELDRELEAARTDNLRVQPIASPPSAASQSINASINCVK